MPPIEIGQQLIDALMAHQAELGLENERMATLMGISENYWSRMRQRPPSRPMTLEVARRVFHAFNHVEHIRDLASVFISKWLRTNPMSQEVSA